MIPVYIPEDTQIRELAEAFSKIGLKLRHNGKVFEAYRPVNGNAGTEGSEDV